MSMFTSHSITYKTQIVSFCWASALLSEHVLIVHLLFVNVQAKEHVSGTLVNSHTAQHTQADIESGQTFLFIFAAVLESQAFGPYQAREDSSQAQPSGAKSETPGHIGGVQLDAATPAGHAMQQATHAEGGGPAGLGEGPDLKAVITEWLEKVFLPGVNAEVDPLHRLMSTTGP